MTAATALCVAALIPCTVAAETPAEAQQRALAGAGAIKVIVRGAGSWIRVTQPELRAAGLPAGVDPAKLQVFADGVEQAVVVTGNGDATFAPDEALELWGVGRDTLSTDARTYWVVVGTTAGARVAKVAPAPGAAAPASFTRSARVADKKVYLSAVRNGEASNFFAAPVGATASTIKVAAPRVAAGAATVRVSLQGMTKGPHLVDVSVGGALAGTCAFADQEAKTCAFAATAVEGENPVTLAARGGSGDFSALSSIELDYAHAWMADDDALAFTAPAATQIAITAFSSADVRVVDVTDPTRPVELTATILTQGAISTARVDTPAGAGTRSLFAFTAARAGKAAAVVADAPSHWGDALDGELVILSHARFLDALAPLVARRAQEGWKVQLIDLQDVYDEAGGGDKSVGAVRAFLRGARERWRVPPRFVLLVGDASFDPRNFTGMGDFDLAPTKMIDAATMETVSDDWIVDFDDDGVPELALGRFPVRTKEEAALLVGKTLGHEGAAGLARGGLFVTDKDGDDGLDFEAASAAAEAKVADLMPTDRYRRGDPTAMPATLLAKLNDGPFLVNYIGHGSVEVWEGLLTSAQAKGLTNAKTSLYVVMNCLNGFFHDLYTESVAEALLKAPQGGAVAVWASSDLAEYAPQPAFNQAFLSRLTRTSLGQTAMAAKSMITDLEARRTWMLFGDPTLFGAPGPGPVTDGGVTDTMVPMVPVPQDGGVEDGGPADGGAPPMTLDAATNPAPSDGGAPPADAAATTDAAAPPTSMGDGGCGCRAGGSTPASALGLLLVGLALVARRARPRGARRWPLALLALVTALGALAAPRTAHAVYAYRKALTIDRNRIGAAGGATTLTNYPLLISMTDANLKTTANSGHVENANGYDITFTGADTTTCGGPSTCTFNYEIEKYVATTGELVAWVQIPVLKTVTNTANTVIYIKYGDNTISSPTQNVNGTWDTSYKGVWHLNQSPGGTAPQMTDSTSTGGHATATNGPTANSTAKIGAGVTLDGTDDYFAFNSSTAFDFTSAETFTMSGWFQTSDSYGPLQSFRGSVNGNPVIDIHVGYDGATTDAGKLLVLVRDDSSGAGYAQVNGGTVANGSWHMYTVTRSAGTISVYLDGAFVTSATGAGAAAAITTNLRNWGRDGNWAAANYGTADQRFLAASIDEMRVSKTIRAAAWIATDYATQNVPGSTFSASGEALASCGDGTKLMAEGCDDGNILDGDGCSSGCAAEAGYTCNGASPTVCSTTCGDGIVAGAEACDDNGTMNGDGCSSACAVEVAYSCSGSPSVCLFARFDYTKTITVDRTKVGASGAATTLSNYPVLVSVTDANLKSTANGGHVRSASGYDIVFRSFTPATCGGATVCTFAHEVESYDPVNGVLLAWVQVPALNTQSAGSDTTFGIYYGNQAIAASTERRTTTWGSTFTGVWHLNQDPGGSAPQMSDATSNGNNGTANTLTAVSSAVMGAGVSTNGTSSSMSFNSGTSLNSASGGAFTYSAWVKVPVAETAGAIVSSRESTGGGGVVIDLMVGLNGSTTDAGKLMALVRDDSNGTFAQVVGPAINDNAWHLVTLTRSNTTIELFMDATSRGTNTNAGAGGSFTTNLRDLGREGRWIQDNHLPPSTNAFLQATFDEFRASNVARDIHWVTTDYNNQSAPSTFLSFGSETATTGSTVAMLASFAASETCAGTAVRWQTTYEVDTLGFNVYRVVGSQREQLNAALIPAAALSGGGARNYQLVDTGSFDPARTYWLETIHFTAENDLRGPATPSAALACEPAQQRPAPTPLTPAGPSATGDEPDLAAGGCSLAGGSGNALALLAALAFLVRARRRR